MTISTYKWTIDRYHQAVEAGVFEAQAVELLDGEIIEISPEGVPHAGYCNDAANYLRRLLGDLAIIREGHPITLSARSEPEPDLAIVEPLEQIYKTEHHPYPENIFWLVEYSNTSLEKDTEIKRKLYAAAGIREYWVVNLKTMELIVYRDPADGDYRSKMTLIRGEICAIAFPDVVISVQRLLS